MSSDTSFRMVSLSSGRTKTSVLFLRVIVTQCAPVRGHRNCSHGQIREETLDCSEDLGALRLPGPPLFILSRERAHCQDCDVIFIGTHIKEVSAVIGSAVCHGTLPYPEWE